MKRKSALVLLAIQCKTAIAEAARLDDLTTSEIGKWVDQGKAVMMNALKAKPEYIREECEQRLENL